MPKRPAPAPAPRKSSTPRWILIGLIVLVVAADIGWFLWHRARISQQAAAAAQPRTPELSPAAREEDAVAARALANYLTRVRAQLRDHDNAFLRVQNEKALSWNIKERADLERDRQKINDLLTATARLADTLQHGAGFIRAELDTAKVPAATRDSAIALYEKSQAPLLPLQLRVFQCDQAIGENALAVLDLLESNWGRWVRDEATGRIDFTDPVVLTAYREDVDRIAQAAVDRRAAQDALANAQKRSPQPGG